MRQVTKAPPINTDVFNDNNTTRIMKTNTLVSTIITDGIATIEGGFISGLVEPTNDNQIATKKYIDDSSGGGGGGGGSVGPNLSIMYNDNGSFAGSSNLMVSDPSTSTESLDLLGTFTNGTITIADGQINGLSTPTNNSDAATKAYVDQTGVKMGIVNLDLSFVDQYTFLPAEMYNNIINVRFEPDNIFTLCAPSYLPPGDDMRIYLGAEFVVGKSWTTIFRGPQTDKPIFMRLVMGLISNGCFLLPYSNLVCGSKSPTLIIGNYTTVMLTSVVTGPATYQSYVVSTYTDSNSTAQITNQGIRTPSFGPGSAVAGGGAGFLLFPIPENPQQNGNSVMYTVAMLKSGLIVRTGLTNNATDTLITASVLYSDEVYRMGSGTFKFYVQNPNNFTITITPPSGWVFKNGAGMIQPFYCSLFWVSYVFNSGDTFELYNMGSGPLSA